MKLHELMHERETDTQAAVPPPITAVCLTKHLKNVRQKTRVNSLPRIRHYKHRTVVFASQRDLNAPARGRKLHRIVEYVPGDLLQSQTIAFHQQKLIADVRTNVNSLRRRVSTNRLNCVINDGRQRHRLLVQRDLAALQSREIEQIV